MLYTRFLVLTLTGSARKLIVFVQDKKTISESSLSRKIMYCKPLPFFDWKYFFYKNLLAQAQRLEALLFGFLLYNLAA